MEDKSFESLLMLKKKTWVSFQRLSKFISANSNSQHWNTGSRTITVEEINSRAKVERSSEQY